MNFKLFIFYIYLMKLISCDYKLWNYDSLGQDYWKVKYPQCNSNMQSPINIISKSASYDETLVDILFINYNTLIQWNITNNGHTSKFFIKLFKSFTNKHKI